MLAWRFADTRMGSFAPAGVGRPTRQTRNFMSVHLQMLGRQLPCNLLDLLQVRALPLASPVHDELEARLERGEHYPDVHYKLGVSYLGRQEIGLARKHLKAAVDAKPGYVAARLALAAAYDLLAQHGD